MEVLVPEEPSFRFGIADSSPYTSSPLSPNTLFDPLLLFHHFTSAPTSPSEDFCGGGSSGDKHDEFAFDNIMLQEIITADKLFEKGRIRPLELIGTAILSRSRGRMSRSRSASLDGEFFIKNRRRSSPSSSGKLATEVPAKGGASKKWFRLKNLLLFRSASEGQAMDRGSKVPLPKFTFLSSVSSQNKKKRCGRSMPATCGDSAEECAKRRGGGGGGAAVSAQEMFYKENKAAAKERGRKTPLPYQRNGLYTCFNPTQSRHSWLLR